MDILKIVLYIIFVIDCIALSAIILCRKESQPDWEQLAVWRILIGDRTRDVLWKVHW